MIKISDGKCHVLVVDDDPAMVRLLGTILHNKFSSQVHVTMTTEPQYVWGLAAEGSVDICLSDLNMPTINGFKLLKMLKEINPLTQVVFLTAHPSMEAAKSAFTMGVDDFLSKPVNLEDVCNCMQFMIQRVQRLRRDVQSPSGSVC